MKLGEAIDLFRRRFRFIIQDIDVLFATVILDGEKSKYYICVADNVDIHEVKIKFVRLMYDRDDVSVNVVNLRNWDHRKKHLAVWNKDGLAEAMPKA